MTTDVTTPVLADLVGSYVNADVYQRYGDVPAAVDAFLSERGPTAEQLPAEIARVLVRLPSEDAVGRHLDELGVGFAADPVRGGYRGWLVEVSRQARTTS